MPEQERAELTRILVSANEVIKTGGVLATLGKEGTARSGDAAGRLETLAKERASASGGKVSYHQAYDQLIDEQPALYQALRAEQRG